jgi:hypothetical protein
MEEPSINGKISAMKERRMASGVIEDFEQLKYLK